MVCIMRACLVPQPQHRLSYQVLDNPLSTQTLMVDGTTVRMIMYVRVRVPVQYLPEQVGTSGGNVEASTHDLGMYWYMG